MEREEQSARLAIAREKAMADLAKLKADNARMKDTIVGLGAIVAEAHAAGFVRTIHPDGNGAG